MKIMKSGEEAVSPVIGVILMVAIVVILAAVIAAFVFGMAGGLSMTKSVGVGVTEQQVSYPGVGTGIVGVILWEGGVDLPAITSWEVRNDAGPAQITDDITTFPPTEITTGPVQVGDVFYFWPIEGQHIIVTATFSDGNTQIIYDRYFGSGTVV